MRLKIAIAANCGLSLCTMVYGQVEMLEATGIVYEDQNRNGAWEAGEPRLAGVLVSNGEDVVGTDSEGRYSLRISEEGGVIFVIKPGQYAPLETGTRVLKGLHYVHAPTGSAVRHYAGLQPTGPLPESINFGLVAHAEPDAYNVLLFGDPQPEFQQEVDWFAKDIVDPLIGKTDAAFGIVLGDIVNDDLTLFAPVNAVIDQLGMPFYPVFGNHDMNFDAPNDRAADDTFEKTYGPSTYAFTYGKTHYVVLDNVLYPEGEGKRHYTGGFRPDQLRFIENFLKHVNRNTLIVFAMHIPLFEPEEWGDTFDDESRERFLALISGQRNTVSLSAHTHTQRHYYFGEGEGWTGDGAHHHYNVGTTCGSWWTGLPDSEGIPDTMMRDGTPNGYAILSIAGNAYSTRWYAARQPQEYVMRVAVPKVIKYGEYPVGSVIVNVFNGCERTKVEYALNGAKEWTSLAQAKRYDPAVTKLWVDYERAVSGLPGRRMNAPEVCHHLWAATLPTVGRAGLQTVRVRVTFPDGAQYEESRSYRLIREASH